jgi:hypothetical protein
LSEEGLQRLKSIINHNTYDFVAHPIVLKAVSRENAEEELPMVPGQVASTVTVALAARCVGTALSITRAGSTEAEEEGIGQRKHGGLLHLP